MATPEKHASEQAIPKWPVTSTSWKPGQSGNPKGRPPRGQTHAEKLRARLGCLASTSKLVAEIATGLGLDPKKVTIGDVWVEQQMVKAMQGMDVAPFSRIVWDRTEGAVTQVVTIGEDDVLSIGIGAEVRPEQEPPSENPQGAVNGSGSS